MKTGQIASGLGKWIVVVAIIQILPPLALAEPAAIAPSDWTRSQNGEMTVYRSGTGREAMIFRNVADVTDPALAVKLIADGLTARANIVVTSRARSESGLAIHDIEYQSRNIVMKGKVIGVRQADGKFLVLAHLAPRSEPGLTERLQTSTEKMASLASAGPNMASHPAKLATAVPAATGKSVPASEILFDLSYNYGVGGAAYPVYDLVALYKDGTAAKLGGYPVDGVDFAALRRNSKGGIGQRRQSGGQIVVNWSDGDSSKLKRTVGPPRPLPGPQALVGRFQAIGGGGNTALGGSVLTAQVKQFTFAADGRFSHASTTSVSSNAAVGGSRSGTAGRWTLNGPTLTLAYNDGRTIRTSVFYSGSRKATARNGRFGVLWIGGEDFRRTR
ncbi:lipocalin-like domain-containing protein [Parasphingorhabdus marina]|nr:lipocalin family protein [Parasphingorhabdus marina]